MSLLLADASFASPVSFTALLAGFAAFSSVIAFYSAVAAFLSWWYDDSPTDIANAAAVGVAYAFVLATYVGGLAYGDALTAH